MIPSIRPWTFPKVVLIPAEMDCSFDLASVLSTPERESNRDHSTALPRVLLGQRANTTGAPDSLCPEHLEATIRTAKLRSNGRSDAPIKMPIGNRLCCTTLFASNLRAFAQVQHYASSPRLRASLHFNTLLLLTALRRQTFTVA
ncbi:unnamed protein product [Protopolystoma xenopodis]|uniref:Uncharacterized protein n=1 Tax=Protopolystoma xenopodis TaxID=117903 RepID=A0A448WE20_9PLAT|nr:unnamed protein product [Protopolystoma xenopodis]